MSNLQFVVRDRCPACEADTITSLYQAPFSDLPRRGYLKAFDSLQGDPEFENIKDATYYLLECEVCGLIFQKEIANDHLMEGLYEYWIDPEKSLKQYQDQDELGYYSYYAQEIMQVIAYLGAEPSRLSTFDFGMGWGSWALMAKAFGCDSYGSELSRECIAHARSNAINVISWDEIPEHEFDYINTEQVFEHLAEPLDTLLHLKMALKQGGILKISVPTANDIERRLRIMDWSAPKGTKNSLNPVSPLGHINFFRRKSILEMVRKAGLEEVLIPIKLQYKYVTDWGGIKKIGKNVLRPIYRNILKRQNVLFFRNVQ